MDNSIKIKGARQHNLKNISLDIPKNKLVVFTGVSGSGKSSLAFDTIYAEGQRRYVESLSAYARQFLGIMEKPDVDLIEGLSPAISIDQKTTSRNPRSTVGTITEIYDYLRLLYARVGHPHCPKCGREISSQSIDQIIESAMEIIQTEVKQRRILRFMVLAPIVQARKGEFGTLLDNLKAKGFSRVRIDGQIMNLEDDIVLIKTNKHTIDVVIDRGSLGIKDIKNKIFQENIKSRLSDSIEQALKITDGLVILTIIEDKGFEMPQYPKIFSDHLFSEKFACPIDNIQLPEIEPRTFSFNSPLGACEKCNGIGTINKVEPSLILSPELSLLEGGIFPFSNMFEHDTWYSRLIRQVCTEKNISLSGPIKKFTSKQIDILLYGTGDKMYKVEGTNRFGKSTYIIEAFTGVVGELENKYLETQSDNVRNHIERYMRETPCPKCLGARLKDESLSITIDGKSIVDITSLSITQALNWTKKLLDTQDLLSDKEKYIGTPILNEINARLTFLNSVGLEYLSLDRPAGTLAGGEAQRIRLASQIGSGLSGVLYVLDEPTIGLHSRDNTRLIDTLKTLRDLGNTVIVVEHDRETMQAADYIFDFGPGAGKNGGSLVARGNIKQIINNPKSITGKYLSGKRKVNQLASQNNLLHSGTQNGEISISGCSEHNLKYIDLNIPLGKFVIITGVSGSGKSTLLVDTLYHALAQRLNRFYKQTPGKFKDIKGVENLNKVILIDQSPIGRTPRSNPATYTGLFTHIRQAFAETRDAKIQGYKPGRFSFNVKGGRCEACEGQGQTKVEMQFMSDLWITCEICKGARYNNQTLEIALRGKNIAEVLKMSVSDALEFFHSYAPIQKKLETLQTVGLDYIELGQSATTLSGGEAQRVKLSTELSKQSTSKTMYVLDEPTTGLHFADLEKLLAVLKMLVHRGNTVVVIEHNLDIIKNADWIIDLGPEGGGKGGEIIAQGTTKDIIKSTRSYTGQFLQKSLK